MIILVDEADLALPAAYDSILCGSAKIAGDQMLWMPKMGIRALAYICCIVRGKSINTETAQEMRSAEGCSGRQETINSLEAYMNGPIKASQRNVAALNE